MSIKKYRWLLAASISLAILSACALPCLAADGQLVDILKYDRAIQVMAMLLVGFGFLMVFLRNYGRSTLTATFLLVSVALPIYMLLDSTGIFGDTHNVEINRLVLAEFAAASLLICAGACLGRLKMQQYILLALFFIPLYMLNEWILFKNGFGLIGRDIFIDTGGSIVIHAFGALFGMGVATAITSKSETVTPIESDYTSDRFSMLGSMVLWVFWPSFCAALVAPELVPSTAVNVVLALCGSTLATYAVSFSLRRNILISDIANASLAGGVAIGATCSSANHPTAFVIGVLGGVLSTCGFAIIQPRIEKTFRMIDTCGVSNLHGWPGLMGGIIAVLVIPGIHVTTQFIGIGITILLALILGYIVGRIILTTGRIKRYYDDSIETIKMNGK